MGEQLRVGEQAAVSVRPPVAKLFSNIAEAVILAATPILVVVSIDRREPVVWLGFWMGAAAFGLSWAVGQQVIFGTIQRRWGAVASARIPEDPDLRRRYLYPRLIAVGAAIAGLSEQTARWLVLRILLDRTNSAWIVTVAAGLGHGGLEAMLLGVAVGAVGLLDVTRPARMKGVRLVGLRRYSAAEHWLAIAERVGVTLGHIGFTILVAQAAQGGSWLWWLAAVLAHSTQDYLHARGQLLHHWPPTRLLLVAWASGLQAWRCY